PLPGSETKDARVATRGVEKPREHFEGGSFARAIRPKKPDQFAFLNLKRDISGCVNSLVLAMKKPDECARKSGTLFVAAINLGELVNLNYRLTFIHAAGIPSRPNLPAELGFEVSDYLPDIGVDLHPVFHQAASVKHCAVIPTTKSFADEA